MSSPSFTGQLVDDAFDLEALFGLSLGDLPFDAFFAAVEVVPPAPPSAPRGVWGQVFRRLVARAEWVAEAAEWTATGTVRTLPTPPARPAAPPVLEPAMREWLDFLEYAHLQHTLTARLAEKCRDQADERLVCERQMAVDLARSTLRTALGRLATLAPDADPAPVLEAIREEVARDLEPLGPYLASSRRIHEAARREADALTTLACAPEATVAPEVLDAVRREICKHPVPGLASLGLRFVWAPAHGHRAETTGLSDGRIIMTLNPGHPDFSVRALPIIVAHEMAHAEQLVHRGPGQCSDEEIRELEKAAVDYADHHHAQEENVP